MTSEDALFVVQTSFERNMAAEEPSSTIPDLEFDEDNGSQVTSSNGSNDSVSKNAKRRQRKKETKKALKSVAPLPSRSSVRLLLNVFHNLTLSSSLIIFNVIYFIFEILHSRMFSPRRPLSVKLLLNTSATKSSTAVIQQLLSSLEFSRSSRQQKY